MTPEERSQEERLWAALMYTRHPVMRHQHIAINRRRVKAGKPPLKGFITEAEATSRSWKAYRNWITH